MIFLLTVTLITVSTACAQEFLSDTVYEVSSNSDPRGQLVVHNHTMDTLFVDTIIMEVVSTPAPSDARLRMTGRLGRDTVASIVTLSGREQQVEILWPFFPANDIVDFVSFCFEYPYSDTSLCVEDTPAGNDAVEVVLKVNWYLTSGDSAYFYLVADYPLQYVLSVKFPSSTSKHSQRPGIFPQHLINGQSVSSRRSNGVRMPVVGRSRIK